MVSVDCQKQYFLLMVPQQKQDGSISSSYKKARAPAIQKLRLRCAQAHFCPQPGNHLRAEAVRTLISGSEAKTIREHDSTLKGGGGWRARKRLGEGVTRWAVPSYKLAIEKKYDAPGFVANGTNQWRASESNPFPTWGPAPRGDDDNPLIYLELTTTGSGIASLSSAPLQSQLQHSVSILAINPPRPSSSATVTRLRVPTNHAKLELGSDARVLLDCAKIPPPCHNSGRVLLSWTSSATVC
uniref:Uncharacterized protein n=1 Tax=Physcomitrium patens TaxID=3218 RepID=A0A2K1K3C8_PHYPA|nr:hypothetical protein PHYPA_012761 [Physcomitrium patens]